MRNLLCAVYLRWSLPFWDFRYETRQFLCVCMCVCVCVCACVRVHGCLLCHSASLATCAIVTNGISTDARLVLLIGCDAFRSAKISFDRSRRTCSSAPSMLRAHTASTASSSLLRGIAQTLGTVSCCVRARVCVRMRAYACLSVSLSLCAPSAK